MARANRLGKAWVAAKFSVEVTHHDNRGMCRQASKHLRKRIPKHRGTSSSQVAPRGQVHVKQEQFLRPRQSNFNKHKQFMGALVGNRVLQWHKSSNPTPTLTGPCSMHDLITRNGRHLSSMQARFLKTHNGGDTSIARARVHGMLQLTIRERADIVRNDADRLVR